MTMIVSYKQFIGGGILGLCVLVGLPVAAAVGSRAVSVQATIENALTISNLPISFGAILTNQPVERSFSIGLSSAFLNEDSVSAVDYQLTLEHLAKVPEQAAVGGQTAVAYCANPANFPSTDGLQSWGQEQWDVFFADGYFDSCAMPLCPFIERIATDSGSETIAGIPTIPSTVQTRRGFFDALEQRGVEIPALKTRQQGSTADVSVTGPVFPLQQSNQFTYQPAYGTLRKIQDSSDIWTLRLLAPCFSSNGQGCSASTSEQLRTLSNELGGRTWSCAARVEVTGIQRQ